MKRAIVGIDSPTTGGFGIVIYRPWKKSLRNRWKRVPYQKLPDYASRNRQLAWWSFILQTILYQAKPVSVVSERTPFGAVGMRKVGILMSECVGVLKGILGMPALSKITLHEYSPATVQKIVAGHGRAGKKVVQARVKKLLPFTQKWTEHERDALAVIVTHLKEIRK